MLDAGVPGICHEPTSCFLIAASSACTDAGIKNKVDKSVITAVASLGFMGIELAGLRSELKQNR